MTGKYNIVFGCFYLAVLAVLGPWTFIQHGAARAAADTDRARQLDALRLAASNDYAVDLQPLSAEQLARANSAAVLALAGSQDRAAVVTGFATGPYLHGGLESVLNILIGILLGLIAIPVAYKQAVGASLIAGTALHSGLMLLASVPDWLWIRQALDGPLAIVGPALLALGLIGAGLAALWRYRPPTAGG